MSTAEAAPQLTSKTKLNASQIAIKNKVCKAFGKNCARTIKIAFCESQFTSNAVGDKKTTYPSYGVLQIRSLPGRPSKSKLFNVDFNIKYAKQMFDKQGWKPWGCNKLV